MSENTVSGGNINLFKVTGGSPSQDQFAFFQGPTTTATKYVFRIITACPGSTPVDITVNGPVQESTETLSPSCGGASLLTISVGGFGTLSKR
jgi:hypothetical protein